MDETIANMNEEELSKIFVQPVHCKGCGSCDISKQDSNVCVDCYEEYELEKKTKSISPVGAL